MGDPGRSKVHSESGRRVDKERRARERTGRATVRGRGFRVIWPCRWPKWGKQTFELRPRLAIFLIATLCQSSRPASSGHRMRATGPQVNQALYWPAQCMGQGEALTSPSAMRWAWRTMPNRPLPISAQYGESNNFSRGRPVTPGLHSQGRTLGGRSRASRR
jgi:hypothetical protein